MYCSFICSYLWCDCVRVPYCGSLWQRCIQIHVTCFLMVGIEVVHHKSKGILSSQTCRRWMHTWDFSTVRSPIQDVLCPLIERTDQKWQVSGVYFITHVSECASEVTRQISSLHPNSFQAPCSLSMVTGAVVLWAGLFFSIAVVLFDCLAGHMQGYVVTPVLTWVLCFPFVSRKYSCYQKGWGGGGGGFPSV